MKQFILALLVLTLSTQAFAGVKGNIATESVKSTTTTEIPYTICTPTCIDVSNTYKYESPRTQGLRLGLGYEYMFTDRFGVDLMGNTTTTFFDLRLESNLIYSVTDKVNLKAGVNRYQEKNDSTFNYKPGTGYQLGAEYKLDKNIYVDFKYLEMNTSYDVSGSNSINDVKKNAVSIGIGFNF